MKNLADLLKGYKPSTKHFGGEDLTVDGIMSQFTTAIANLKVVEQQELENAKTHTATIQRAQLAHEASNKEAERAKAIASKLSEIVGA